MHNKKIHIKFGGKIHKVLFDNAMGSIVGTSAVAQNDYGISVRILCLQVLIPYPFYIVADKFGCVLTRAYRHISHIFCHIVDSVRDNLTIGECPEIVINGFWLTKCQDFSVPFEVSDEFLLLRVNADYGKSCGRCLFSDVCSIQKLSIPVLDILHGKIFYERPMSISHLLKHLSDKVFGYIASLLDHLSSNHGYAQGNPDDIFILRKTSSMRFNDQFERFKPFRMFVQFRLSSSARLTNTSLFRSITGIDFINGVLNCVFAHAEKLTNLVHAAFTQGESLGSEILSLLVFVERRHKLLFLSCKHFWRSFRNHLKYRGKVLKLRIFLQFCNFIYLIINYLTIIFYLFGEMQILPNCTNIQWVECLSQKKIQVIF